MRMTNRHSGMYKRFCSPEVHSLEKDKETSTRASMRQREITYKLSNGARILESEVIDYALCVREEFRL